MLSPKRPSNKGSNMSWGQPKPEWVGNVSNGTNSNIILDPNSSEYSLHEGRTTQKLMEEKLF